MKINQQIRQTSTTNQAQTISKLLVEGTVTNGVLSINSFYPPIKIFWEDADHNGYIDSTPTSEKTNTGYLYTPSKSDFTPTKAYYIPSQTMSIQKIIEDLKVASPMTNKDTELFDFLNLKMEAANKNLSSWDTYQIYKVIYNTEEFSEALSSLPLSASILVNTEESVLQVGAWTVQKGDMIVKDRLGQLHHLKGANGGFYFPSSITPLGETGIFQINFTYSQQTPTQSTNVVIDEDKDPLTQPYTDIKIKFPTVEETDSTLGYSGRYTLASKGSQTINYLKESAETNASNIEPIVYYYFEGERIIFPSDYTATSSSFTVSNPSNLEITCEVR